ncbi:MAG TPA: hypothetical protein VF204_23390 [Streptosporangiaceae bacterium]
MPSAERRWQEGQEQRGSPIPVEEPGNHNAGRDEGEDRIRGQEPKLARNASAEATEPGEHPSDPVAPLCQVDYDQACERQPYVGVDGVADVEELQGSERRRGEDQEAQVHKPARPDTPSGPRSRPSSVLGTGRFA